MKTKFFAMGVLTAVLATGSFAAEMQMNNTDTTGNQDKQIATQQATQGTTNAATGDTTGAMGGINTDQTQSGTNTAQPTDGNMTGGTTN